MCVSLHPGGGAESILKRNLSCQFSLSMQAPPGLLPPQLMLLDGCPIAGTLVAELRALSRVSNFSARRRSLSNRVLLLGNNSRQGLATRTL